MTIRRELHVVRTRLGGRLPKPLLHQAVPDYEETKAAHARRKIVVTGVSALGAALLGRSLSTRPGSREFYTRTLSVAATWTAGGLLSGPLHLGWIQGRDEMLRRPVLTPVATGIGAFGFFYASALVSRRIPFLDDALTEVLRFADQGATPLVVLSTGANGMAEEVFFRGALYAAVGERHPVVATTAVYTLTAVPTRNPALVLAAAVMGAARIGRDPGVNAHPRHVVKFDAAPPPTPVSGRGHRPGPLRSNTRSVLAQLVPCDVAPTVVLVAIGRMCVSGVQSQLGVGVMMGRLELLAGGLLHIAAEPEPGQLRSQLL